MMDTLLDAVQAKLAGVRENREKPDGAQRGMEPPEPYALELADLTLIAERHYGKGFNGGYRNGYMTGRQQGIEAGGGNRRREDWEIFQAIVQTLNERLDRWTDRLAEAPEGAPGDRRSKAKLREEALQLIDEMRAALSTTLVSFTQGAFDEGS